MPATLTVPLGEMHEDFKTLKEEVQRETQEVEKLSPEGQSSLLTSLSNLLGKKKELQDLEQTVRHLGNWKCGGRRVWVIVDGEERRRWHRVARDCGTNSRYLSQGWPSVPRLLGRHWSLCP